MNYYHYFKNTVLRFPEKTAVYFQNQKYSYREFDERICRLASIIKRYHIEAGKRVGLVCSNCNAYLEIIFATSMLGAVSEQFNWRTSSAGIVELVEDSSVELLFVTADFKQHYEYLKEYLKKQIPIILIGNEASNKGTPSYESMLNSAPINKEIVEIAQNDPLFIYYTSGTTNKPKRVLLSLGSVFQHNMALLYEMGWKEDEQFLHYLPLFHSASGGVFCTLFTGGTVVLMSKFNLETWLQIVQEKHITSCGMVPNVISWLTKHPDFSRKKLSSLRWMIYAGGPMPASVLKEAVNRLGCLFIQLYGMTEMCPTVAILKPEDHIRFLDSEKIPNGRPLIGTQISVVDNQNQPCEPYKVGEVVVRSGQMMIGYDGQPALTASVIRDGWYHTEDLGYLDEHQYLYLSGRKNRMIISGGENIYPSQVENCIRAMGNEIRDVAVVGVADCKWGEAVAAGIVLKKGCKWDKEKILSYCQEHLPGYMKPRYIRFMDTIPYNENGKVLYKELIGEFEGNL